MRAVTANGTIVDLSPGRIVLHPKYDHEQRTVLSPHQNNDLFFAMRGAGASFAIATEFLYQIYPTPETQPAIFLGTVDILCNVYTSFVFLESTKLSKPRAWCQQQNVLLL